jgi:NAD(P)-dependent dehydrogenase (short-subunit alcohol dehydrogenase family)
MNRLQDKVAIVTGAASGIGRGIALAFAREGAHIAVNDVRQDERPEQVADEVRALERRALVVRADVSMRPAVNEMVARVLAEFGQIDILVNNAGVNIYQPFLEIEQRVWDLTIGVDQTGVFNCSQEVARHMLERRQGKIIIIASVSAEEAYTTQTHYCAAKAAVVKLGEGMAFELSQYGINTNMIGPGWVETPLTSDYLGDSKLRRAVEATIPIGRVAQPEDIANIAVFLASSEADYLSGAYIRADGGLIAGRGKT